MGVHGTSLPALTDQGIIVRQRSGNWFSIEYDGWVLDDLCRDEVLWAFSCILHGQSIAYRGSRRSDLKRRLWDWEIRALKESPEDYYAAQKEEGYCGA